MSDDNGVTEHLLPYWRRRLAEGLAPLLDDENGLPPTQAALDVILAVVLETVRTDEKHGKAMANRSSDQYNLPTPTLSRYAIDAERALRALRKNQ